MGIVLKSEHLLSDVSAMMCSELQRHCNNFWFKTYFTGRVPTGPRTA